MCVSKVSKYLTLSLTEIMVAALCSFSHFKEQFGEIDRRGQKNIFGLLTSAFVKAIYPEKKLLFSWYNHNVVKVQGTRLIDIMIFKFNESTV